MNTARAVAASAAALALLAAGCTRPRAADRPSARPTDAAMHKPDRATEVAVARELSDFQPSKPRAYLLDASMSIGEAGSVARLRAMGGPGLAGILDLLRQRDPVFERLGAANFATIVQALECRAAVEPLLRPDPGAMTVPWQNFAAAARIELALDARESPPR